MCHQQKINWEIKIHNMMLDFIKDTALDDKQIIIIKHDPCPQCDDYVIEGQI